MSAGYVLDITADFAL